MKKFLLLTIALLVLLIPNLIACAQPQQSERDSVINVESLVNPTPIPTPTPTPILTPTPIIYDPLLHNPLKLFRKFEFSISEYSVEGDHDWSILEKSLGLATKETLARLPRELLLLLKEKPPLIVWVYFKYVPHLEEIYQDSSSNQEGQRYFVSADLADYPGSGLRIEGSYYNFDILSSVHIWVKVYSPKFFKDLDLDYLKKYFTVIFLHELGHAFLDRLSDQIKIDYAIAGGYVIELNEFEETQFTPQWKTLEMLFLGFVSQEPDSQELELYGLPTIYSAREFSEDFAEAFALYFLYPEYLKKYGITRYEFMDSWLKNLSVPKDK